MSLAAEFSMLRMEQGEEPTKFIMRKDEAASEWRRVGTFVEEDENNISILNRHTEEYTIERRMLGEEAEDLSREHIERVLNNQYQRLQRVKRKLVRKCLWPR